MPYNYNINWRLWIARNVDTMRRQTKRLSWLYALITQVRNIHAEFLVFKLKTDARLRYNSQVIYLERGLNERFNGSLPAYTTYTPEGVSGPVGIYISLPNVVYERTYIFRKPEDRPKTYIYEKGEGEPTTYLFRKSEIDSQPDFIVNVPDSVGDVTADLILQKSIRAYVNLYRYASKSFTIVNYTP